MKFSPDLTPELIPSKVYDANGHEIEFVYEGDTETGVCICLSVMPDGGFDVDYENGRAVRKVIIAPPPLRLEPCTPKRAYSSGSP